MTTILAAIFTSSASGLPMRSQQAVELIAGLGIAGDRYATGRGFYSGVAEWDAHATLISREPFDSLAEAHGPLVAPADLRRNLVTVRVDLSALIGVRFRIGDRAILHGRKAWPPCAHIVKSSGKVEIYKYLACQCGIGADVLEGGTIRVGDLIVVLPGGDSV